MAITAALPLSFEKRIKIEQRTDYGTKCLAQNPVDALDDLRINVELERTGAGPDAFSSCNFKAAMVVCCAWLIVYIMMAVCRYATVAG